MTRKHGQKRPQKPSCETSSRKGFFLLLAISALAIASQGFAQQGNNSSPDGLYALPDPDIAQKSPSNRSAQSYLSELDPQAARFKNDMEKAEVARQAAASAKRLKYQAAGGSILSSWTSSISERTWIEILAGGGLLVSLAAGGYVWWTRIQSSKASRAILLAVKWEPTVKPGSTAKQDKTPVRRAA